MVPDDASLSRRQLLGAGGAAGALLGGGALARRLLPTAAGSTADASRNGWPMAGRDAVGTAYAPDASPPTDGVAVRWEQPMPLVPDPDPRPSPAVANGVVYAAGGELLAASVDDGAVVARLPARSDASPVVAPGRAYRSRTAAALRTPSFEPPRLVGFHGRGSDTVAGVALDETRWRTPVDPGSDSYSMARYGGGARPPPVAVGDALLAFFGGTLAAVDASNGAVRWRADDGDDAARPTVSDGTAYVPVSGGDEDGASAIRAYDVETGELTRTTVDAGRINYLTAVDGGFVAAGSAGLLRLSADGRVDWREPAPDDAYAGPTAVADDTVYAALPVDGGRRLAAVDAADGSRRWTSDLTPADDGSALPAASDDLVCVPAADGSLAGVDAADGTVRWRFDPEGERCSPAALAGDAAYVLTNEHLYALEEP